MTGILINRGDFHFGKNRVDADGNVVEHTDPKFEPNENGKCVAVSRIDMDKLEPVGAVEIYGDWQAAQYLAKVLENLGPVRPVNVPDFRDILKMAINNGQSENYFCDFCERYGDSCRDCIVTEWMEERHDT